LASSFTGVGVATVSPLIGEGCVLTAWEVLGFGFVAVALLVATAVWVGGTISPGAGASVTGISEVLGSTSDGSPEPKSENPKFNSKP
jgi:hypothetical protein